MRVLFSCKSNDICLTRFCFVGWFNSAVDPMFHKISFLTWFRNYFNLLTSKYIYTHLLTSGSNYYLQAALDASMPNPFLLTDSPAQQQSGDSDFGLASGSGGGTVSERRAPPTRPGPPQRPPPPSQTGGPLVGAVSPAHAPQAAAAPKSAFDDLNDTIRMALGNSGSPARNTSAATGAGTAGLGNVSQNVMQQASTQQPQPMYSSPAKQPAPGLGLCQSQVP